MLKALPRSYSHIGDLIDVLPERDRTVEYLKGKIKLKALEKKNESEGNEEVANNNSNAFTAINSTTISKKQNSCYKCGKVGHFQKDCIIKQIRAVIGEIISVVSIKAIVANTKTIEDNIEAKEVIEDEEVMKPVIKATHVMEVVL